MSTIRPLDGVTVVELGQVVAGPFATMTLGDLGAEVIKIEPPGRGDLARSVEPAPEYFDTVNRNKRSVALDLKSASGQAVALELLATADAFVENTKPGRIETFGLDLDSVRAVNPEIVYCTITGFGADSPYENVPAFDMIIQAMSGIMGLTGREGEPPLWSGLPSGDLAASMYAIQSVIAALYAREAGRIDGEYVEVPMLDAAVSWLCARAAYTFRHDEPRPRTERHTGMAPFGPFECADGRMVLAAGTDSLWRVLCEVIERRDLAADGRFESIPDRLENRPALIDELDATFAEETREHWLERLHARQVPAAPIYDTKEVWEDEHVLRRGLRTAMSRPDGPDATVIASPVRFERLTSDCRDLPPDLGGDTDAVLTELGYDAEAIDRLRSEGSIE